MEGAMESGEWAAFEILDRQVTLVMDDWRFAERCGIRSPPC